MNISTYQLPQFTDLVNRSFMAAQKELPQEVFNSDFVVKDVKPHQTGDSTRYAERPDKNQYASFRAE